MFVVTVVQGVVIDEQRHVRHPQLGGRADHFEPVIAAVIASRTCRVRAVYAARIASGVAGP